MLADIVIKGGTVIDGTGSAGFVADVAITGDTISAIGDDLSGRRVLDATDHVVAPGFIDVHTHYDAQVFWDPAFSSSCFHGVTTVVAGNCGFSIAPLRAEHRDALIGTLERVEDMNAATLRAGVPWDEFETFGEYLDAVERRGVVLNYGCYVGHTAVRLHVLGDASQERSATAEEVSTMRSIVEDAVASGAAGFATSFGSSHVGYGGKPVASRAADLEELCTLVEPLGDLDRGMVTILVGAPVTAADLPTVQRRARRPVTWTPMIVRDGYPYAELLADSRTARREGIELWPQTSSRPITMLETLGDPFTFNRFPAFAQFAGRPQAERVAGYADSLWRERAKFETGPGTDRPVDWTRVRVGETGLHGAIKGRTISSLADERGVDPLDVAIDLAMQEHLGTRFETTVANDDVGELAKLVADDAVVIGLGDGGAHVGQIYDACFPTDMLATWVREREVLTLPQAIWKLSGLPAQMMRLHRRGRLRVGAAADVVVFQPDEVGPGTPRRCRDLPAGGERLVTDAPTGVAHVLVNGEPIRVDGAQVDLETVGRPGHVVRDEWASVAPAVR